MIKVRQTRNQIKRFMQIKWKKKYNSVIVLPEMEVQYSLGKPEYRLGRLWYQGDYQNSRPISVSGSPRRE